MTDEPYRERPPRRALSQRGGQVSVSGERAVTDLLAHALTLAGKRAPEGLTYDFHSYPARMHPAIAESVISAWSRRGDWVLDPFCGSGTVLVAARASGRACAGVDLNPLALRIAEVKTSIRGPKERKRFERTLKSLAVRSTERVKARVPSRAPVTREEAQWWDVHVLKELAGLREEIHAVSHPGDRRALEVVLSAIVVKFSRRQADTSRREVKKRIRKGLATEFFERKGLELVERWRELHRHAPRENHDPVLKVGDARELDHALHPRDRFRLVLTSPPYGGTYDYLHHHELRYPWLGIDAERLARDEIGARRHLKGPSAHRRWDYEVESALRSSALRLDDDGRVVWLIGDAQLEGRRVNADEQVLRLAGRVGLEVVGVASQRRADWTGKDPRREHLIAMIRTGDEIPPARREPRREERGGRGTRRDGRPSRERTDLRSSDRGRSDERRGRSDERGRSDARRGRSDERGRSDARRGRSDGRRGRSDERRSEERGRPGERRGRSEERGRTSGRSEERGRTSGRSEERGRTSGRSDERRGRSDERRGRTKRDSEPEMKGTRVRRPKKKKKPK